MSVYPVGEEDITYLEELTLVKHKNNRYMWKEVSVTPAFLVYTYDSSINIFLKGDQLSRFGSFYFFRESHLKKTKPFWSELWSRTKLR